MFEEENMANRIEIGFDDEAKELLRALTNRTGVPDLIPLMVSSSNGPLHVYIGPDEQEHFVKAGEEATAREHGWLRLYVEVPSE
jgi:hypothetical protein